MSELKPRMVCDLCRKGDGDNLCYAGGMDKCLKDGQYTQFELRRANQDCKDSKCTWPDGVEAKIYNLPVDPCIYTNRQRLHNVDITISECEKCGAIDISWSKNEDTEVIYEDADFVKRSRE